MPDENKEPSNPPPKVIPKPPMPKPPEPDPMPQPDSFKDVLAKRKVVTDESIEVRDIKKKTLNSVQNHPYLFFN